MFGVVCHNEDTDNNEPWTIAGPTDGSTNIVRHECDCDYAIPTAIPDQLGAGYLGLSVMSTCNKATFNPSNGYLTAKCFKGTAECVDINDNSLSGVDVPLLVRGTTVDGDTGTVSYTKKVEVSNMTYNSCCYICNDEGTGEPVCIPVTCIPTLKVSELIGPEQGATVMVKCDDCSFPIVFTDCTGENSTLYVDSDTTYNPHTNTLDVDCIGRDGLLIERGTSNWSISSSSPSSFNSSNIVVGTSTSTICSTVTENGTESCTTFSVLPKAWSITDGTYSLSKTCGKLCECHDGLELLNNTISVSPLLSQCSLSVRVSSLPYTESADSANFELVGINVSNDNVKKLDGISYNPVTCALEGNIVGKAICDWGCTRECDISEWPEMVNLLNGYDDSGSGSWCPYKNIYLGCERTGIGYIPNCKVIFTKPVVFCSAPSYRQETDPQVGSNVWWTINCFGSYEGMFNQTACVSLDGSSGARMVGSSSVLMLVPGCGCVYVDCMGNNNYSNYYHCFSSPNGGSFEYFNGGTTSAGCHYYMCVSTDGAKESFDNGQTWQYFGHKPRAVTPTTMLSAFSCLNGVGDKLLLNGSITSCTITPTGGGGPVTICYLLGELTCYETNRALFTGLVRDTLGIARNASIWMNPSGIESSYVAISPVCGTMWGTASTSTINVCGTV